MFRIFHRALVLLVGMLVLVNLIAARPLPPVPRNAPPGRGFFLGWLPSTRAQLRETSLSYAPRQSRPRTALRTQRDRAPDVATRLLVRSAPAGAPSAARAGAAAPARIPGDGPRMRGSLVAQTERLDLYVGTVTFSADQVAALAPLLEQVLRDDEARFGTTLKHRVSLGFYRPALAPHRGVRGMAYTDSGRVELFYRPYEDIGRAAAVAAHELGHHLEAQRYGEDVQRRADTILHEGMATWIAGDRWLALCDGISWKEHARQLGAAGVPLRLLTAERSGADNAYELWASFVDFLAKRYGWGKLDALYQSGRGRAPGSANYQKVLGKSLDELADEWRDWVKN